MILRARAVVPVNAPPIENGAILIARGRIREVGTWRELSRWKSRRTVDLGDCALLPGLVNAHCHLDYTAMAGLLPPPRSFADWLKSITATKSEWNSSDYAASWLAGAEMLVRTGTTTVADVEAIPELLPKVWGSTPLRVISFLEMIGITGRRSPREILGTALALWRQLPDAKGRLGLSPHAPYSTLPELLRLCGKAAKTRRCQIVTHVSESALEYEMFSRGRGEMYSWLKRSSRDMSDCGQGSPVQHLDRCGLLSANLIAVHANYLGRKDAELLGARGVTVVHCPRSHRYFGHENFPLRPLLRHGVNICLGTDSLASVRTGGGRKVQLDLFAEMRTMAQAFPALKSGVVLQMATLNGARALGFKGEIGEFSPGASADAVAIPFTGKMTEVLRAIVHHQGPIAASLIRGRWAVGPP